MSFVISRQFIQKAIDNQAENEKCIDLHPGSCNYKALMQAVSGIKSTATLYLIVHAIPLLLKYKRTAKNPTKQITKMLKGYIKSMLFVGGTLFLLRRLLCLFTQIYKYKNTNAVYTGFCIGFPLLLESKGRQIQISLYVLQRSSHMFYNILRRRYPWLYIKNGQMLLTAISMSIVSYQYFADRELFRSIYQQGLDFFLKDI